MATLAELWDVEPVAPTGAKIPGSVQAARDQEALRIRQSELQAARQRLSQGDPRAKGDIEALTREISRLGGVAETRPGETLADIWESTPAAAPTKETKQEETSYVRSKVADILQKAQEYRRTVQEVTGGLVGGAAGAVLGPVAGVIETIQSGKYGTPEGARIGQQKAEAVQRGLMPEITTPGAQEFFGGLGKAVEVSKIPPVLTPELAALAPVAGPATTQAAREVTRPIKEAIKEIEIVPIKPKLTQAEAEAQFQTKVAPGSAGAAAVAPNPYVGKITGEEKVRGDFPQVKLSKTPENVPVGEQSIRAQIANEVLGTNQVRPGVVTGNENLLRNEYTLAKRPEEGPVAELLKRQIADEQVALSKYAEDRVRQTGASETLVTPYERGERINSFFAGTPAEGEAANSLTSFFKQEKKKMYDFARQTVGDNPIKTSHIDTLLGDPQFRSGLKLTSTEGVAAGAEELIKLAKTTGFTDAGGTFHAPNTIGAWDAVRKAINDGWTPSNAKTIRNINLAIDKDIASAGGGDLLKNADKLHEMEKTIFGSKGIKNAFGVIDSNGVETGKVSFDALPQKLNSMPFNEWKHIYETADKMSRGEFRGPIDPKTGQPKFILQVPPELQQAAQNTKAEMLGNLAREVQQAGGAKAGVWNQNAANKILNARADKIKYAFPLEEQQAFHKLNYAGYLMPGEHGYEGAALQGRRVGMIEGQLEKAGAAAGATVGGFLGGTPGAAVGTYLGQKAGAKGAEKIAARKAIKEAERRQEEMKKTSRLSDLIPK
jgi:hypothetical protein